MERGRETWMAATLVALVVLAVACSGVELRRPLIAYDFDNPILNEQWLRAHHDPALRAATKAPAPAVAAKAATPVVAKAAAPVVAKAAAPVVARAASPTPAPAAAAPESPRAPATRPLPVLTASEQQMPSKAAPPVVAKTAPPSAPAAAPPAPAVAPAVKPSALKEPTPEVADAAVRLVGIRSSFDQDSFLKHVLFVSGVALDDAPGEGLVGWVWKQYGKGSAAPLAPGRLVFLGWGGRARMVGVVESVDEHGTAQFVTVQSDEVKRLIVTPAQPRARRDERTGRILNSPLGRGRMAGEVLMGSVAVVPDATGSSALATAE